MATLIEGSRWLTDALASLLNSAGDRLGPPFLIGAALMASVIWWRHVRHGASRTTWLGFLFPRALWLHPSARLDYRLLAARIALDLAVLGALSISTTKLSYLVARTLWRHVGIVPDLHMPDWFVTAAFSIAAFVAEDLARFWVHRAFHRLPRLWELHKLHHSAEVLTPFTIYRVHPIEGLANSSAAAIAVGVTAGLIAWVAPSQLHAWTIAGIYALQYVWNVLGTNLRHSHVWLSYGPRIEHWLLSPAQHQIHHSRDPKHFDRNFGSALALWDRWFNSLYVTQEREPLQFGLPEDERNHDNRVLSALGAPLLAALQPNRRPHNDGPFSAS